MIKIIKYSITLIIFSIITSLFILYFYLLKGINIENLHYNFINIGKLYIKIDKKVVIKAKNIDINLKNSNNSKNSNLNFQEIKSTISKSIKILDFFQLIKIENLNINKNHINFISLKDHTLEIDNKDVYLQTFITHHKKNLSFSIKQLNLKNLNLYFNNIYTSFIFNKSQLDIYFHLIYKHSDAKINLTITKSSHIFYNGYIRNITSNTLNFLKEKLVNIQNLSLQSLTFKNDSNGKINFKIDKFNFTFNNNKITTPILRGNFDTNINKISLKSKNIIALIKQNKIDLTNTELSYYLNKKEGYIHNDKINIKNKLANITLIKNKVYYTPKISTIKSKTIIIHHKMANIILSKLKAQYFKKTLYAYILDTSIHSKDIKAKIKDTTLIYNPKSIQADIPFIEISKQKIYSKIKNTNLYYSNNNIFAKINKIYINAYPIKGNIYNNKIKYNLNSNTLNINNKKAFLSYLKIKHINLYNIKTLFDIKKNQLKTNIPMSYINKIKLSNLNIKFSNDLIDVIFYTKTLLSKNLNNILKNFGINISIYQATGKNKIKANIKYNLKNSNLNTDIKIDVKNSKLMLTKTTYLNIHHSNLELKDTNITLKNTSLDYNKSIVNLNYYIKKGLINLNKSYIQTDGKFNDLNITNIVEIKNYPEKLYIDLKGIDIFLKNLKVDVLIHKNIIVNINKLSKFYPFINYLQEYKINEGKIKINIADNITIDSNITKTNQPILESNLKPIKKLNIKTTINNNIYTIENKNLNIKIVKEKFFTMIDGKYKNLDLNITKFVDQNNTDNNNSSIILAKIKSINSYIRYHNVKLYSKHLDIDYNTTNAKITSLYKDRNLTVLYNNNGKLRLYGLNIREKTFKDLTNTNILNQPLINLFVLKNKNSDILQGFIEIKKGYIKELKVFNNILAFINLIPSLITFQPAGFNSKGYRVKYGYIDFFLYNNVLYLHKVSIKGENMTFSGKGWIDLKKKTMEVNLKINLLVKLVKDIPIVNYILLGEDGGITLNILVDGSFDNPVIHKNAVSNLISSPLNIIKRLILTPFRPFMKKEEK